MTDVTDYTGLVTSEHADKPNFMAMVGGVAQAFVDIQNQLSATPPAFDLDSAVGVQLDAVGLWVGVTRNVSTPLTGVYFSLDTVGLGFDQGVWQGPFDPTTGVVSLDDDTYRLLIRAKIGANSWDGTLGTSAAILNTIFNKGNAAVTGPVSITANGEPFGTGDGSTAQFHLKYGGQQVLSVSSVDVYRADWQGNQLLYTNARVNGIGASEVFSSNWPMTRATVTQPGTVLTPRGTSAFKIVEDTSASTSHYISRVSASSYSTGDNVCASALFYAGERSQIRFGFAQSGAFTTSTSCLYDLATQSVTVVGGSPNSYGIIDLGGGWLRCWINATATAAGTATVQCILASGGSSSYTGDGASGLYIDAVQVERRSGTSSRPTSYISCPTTAATTLVDYAVDGLGSVILTVAPLAGSTLSWSGSGTIYPAGTYVFIQDNGDMSITYGIAGNVPSAIFLALLRGGYIPLKPEAVHINGYYVTSNPGSSLFGFDVENNLISGFDVGAWGVAA
jgi:hypothetical protein